MYIPIYLHLQTHKHTNIKVSDLKALQKSFCGQADD